MNLEETRTILNILRTNYPNTYRNLKRDEMHVMLNLWAKQFENIPYRFVEDAIGQIISTDDREFAPNVGQVKTRILYGLAPDTDEKALHAWEQLRKFIGSCSSWNTKEEEMPMYNKLDDITKGIYTYREAKSLSQFGSEVLEYRRSEFIRLYKQLTERKNEKLLSEGKLVELAGGQDRFMSLGYSVEDVNMLQIGTAQKGMLEIGNE